MAYACASNGDHIYIGTPVTWNVSIVGAVLQGDDNPYDQHGVSSFSNDIWHGGQSPLSFVNFTSIADSPAQLGVWAQNSSYNAAFLDDHGKPSYGINSVRLWIPRKVELAQWGPNNHDLIITFNSL